MSDRPPMAGETAQNSSPPLPHPPGKPPRNRASMLSQWAYLAIGLQEIRVRVRSQGNHLHLLCEANPCPAAMTIIARLIPVLASTDLTELLPPDHPPIYQVYVYGRTQGDKQAGWAKIIYLNQIDRYLEQLKHPVAEALTSRTTATIAAPDTATATLPDITSSALIVPNRTLAARGEPEAIARYLSETLSAMGIAVEVSAKFLEAPATAGSSQQQRNRRLWILCTSTYSPDLTLVSEPIAEQLRSLKLEAFSDAIIFSQVTGEENADWALRVDLTPPEEMLREWAQWGDLSSLTRLLSQALADRSVSIAASLQDTTLHIFCELLSPAAAVPTAPHQQSVMSAVKPLLESIGPQGIHSAAVYGQITGQDAPAWVEWISLPAAIHPALTAPAKQLAQQGDQPALLFLLHRLLNPDLDRRLATGGIRVQIRRREDLLHVMTDAPTCPERDRVGPEIATFLRQLHLAGLAGARVYGRRAGQKRPLWSYGFDFVQRQRLVPEAAPEFAASDAYVGALLIDPAHLTVRPDLTVEDIRTQINQITQKVTVQVQQWLIKTQLFVLQDQVDSGIASETRDKTSQFAWADLRVATIWGLVGVVCVFSGDRILGQILQNRAQQAAIAAAVAETPNRPTRRTAASVRNQSFPIAHTAPRSSTTLPNLRLKKSKSDREGVFNSSGFTKPGDPSTNLTTPVQEETGAANSLSSIQVVSPTAPSGRTLPASDRPALLNPKLLATVRSPYPTFNSRQFDQQLALYYQHLALSGPPDILVVGSSRALRGIDPLALQTALAAQGHPSLKIFNFGINGATVQVVDLLIRQILTPDQLPRMILWADGARAFNSGRVDVTYNGILASAGYRSMMQKGHIVPTKPGTESTAAAKATKSSAGQSPKQAPRSPQEAISQNYQAMNDQLNQSLAQLSKTYAERQALQAIVRDQFAALFPTRQLTLEQAAIQQNLEQLGTPHHADGTIAGSEDNASPLVDLDGFMALSIRYNPATYYQRYARVSGDFDGDYANFQLKGKQAEALKSLLAFTRPRNIPIVFVNLPLTQEYLDPTRWEYEQQFQQSMLSLAASRQLIFRDLGQIWPTTHDYFSDPSHLNRYGAYAVSRKLAQDPLISWPRGQ